MFETPEDDPVRRYLACFDALLAAGEALELATLDGERVIDLAREKEARVRRLAVLDQAVIAEIEQRGLARERGCSSTGALLIQLLRISQPEASARVAAARRLAPRRGLTP